MDCKVKNCHMSAMDNSKYCVKHFEERATQEMLQAATVVVEATVAVETPILHPVPAPEPSITLPPSMMDLIGALREKASQKVTATRLEYQMAQEVAQPYYAAQKVLSNIEGTAAALGVDTTTIKAEITQHMVAEREAKKALEAAVELAAFDPFAPPKVTQAVPHKTTPRPAGFTMGEKIHPARAQYLKTGQIVEGK